MKKASTSKGVVKQKKTTRWLSGGKGAYKPYKPPGSPGPTKGVYK